MLELTVLMGVGMETMAMCSGERRHLSYAAL